MVEHDVVVIGGGPAGATAARFLAAGGARTVLLERAAIGRDKPCGGGLTPRSYQGLDVDISDLIRARTGVARLWCGDLRPLSVDLEGADVWMVRRRDFDRRLVEAAAAAGAEVRDRTPVTAVDEDASGFSVVAATARYRARVVLLATGAEAPLRRSLTFEPPTPRMAAALEIEGPGGSDRLDGTSFVFDYSVPGGYAWAFPKGEWWNAGILTTRPGVGRELRERLGGFLDAAALRFDDPALAPSRATGRRIPFWLRPARIHRGRVALLGDAAGLADPLFGEGIAQALASGRLAAAAAIDVVAGRADDLDGYARQLERHIGRHLWRARQTARLLYARPAWALRGLRAVSPARRIATRVATEPFATRL